MAERERDRVAQQVRAAIGGAANPTQAGFGVVGIDQASDAVMSVIDPILSARDAHFEARNRMTEQSDHWKGRAETAEAAIERIRKLHHRIGSAEQNGYCLYDSSNPWPCPTIRALDEPEVPA